MRIDLKNRQQLLAVVAIAAVALFAADRLIRAPLASAWNARAKRIADLRTQIHEGKALLDRQHIIQSRWRQMDSNTLTNNPSIAEQQVVQAIDRWRQDSHVTFNGVTPQWKHDDVDYMTYDCRVDVSGDIQTLSKFLYDVERDPLALKLESVEFSTRDKEGQQLTLAVQINGLVLLSQPQSP